MARNLPALLPIGLALAAFALVVDRWGVLVIMLAVGFGLGVNFGAWLLARYVNDELSRRLAPYQLERRGGFIWRLYRLPTSDELKLY